MILTIALGIVLGVFILNLMMTEMFWKILGIILLAMLGLIGVWLIWLLCVWGSEHINDIIEIILYIPMFILVGGVMYTPIWLCSFLLSKWKFKKFKIIYYPQKSYGKLVSRLGTEDTYTDSFQNIENKVFTKNKLNRDNYEIQIIHQNEKDIYLYTKKGNK